MASQFGQGNKNPPWARQATDFMAANAVGGMQQSMPQSMGSGLLPQPGLATNPTVYSLNQATAMQQQQQYAQSQMASVMQNQQTSMQHQQHQQAALPQPGMAMPTTLGGGSSQVATVSYPTARASQAPQASAASASQKQRVFTGTVTKLHDNFGFIDEDVFFQTNCVKGMVPKVGDRVLVEASYNAAMPFKWNATRVQPQAGPSNQSVNQHQQQLSAMQQAVKTMGLGAMGPAPNAPGGMLGGVNPLQLAGAMAAMSNAGALMGSLAGNRNTMNQSNRGGRAGSGGPGLMSRGAPGSNRPAFNEPAAPSRFSEDRDRDRDRGRDRDRREKRESRRRSRSASPARRSRSPKRKVSRPPPRYVVQVPRFTLNTREANVMTLRCKYTNLYVPSDFFHSSFPWVDNLPLQRPFAMSTQGCKFHVMHKEVGPLALETAVLDPPDADHKYFAKVMLMTTPSLEELYSKSCSLAQDTPDTQDSFVHPTRLVQFLVGTRGKNEPMAIGGPWSPSLDGENPDDNPQVLIKTAIRTTKALTGIDLSKCTQWYRFAEIRYMRAESRDKPARVETVVLFLPDVWRCTPTRLEWTNLQKAYAQKLHKRLNPDAADPEEPQGEEGEEVKKEPTHFSKLDPKSMKLQELREELDCRTLSSKGLKSQLIARLTKALLLEEEAENNAEAERMQKEKEEAEKKAKEEEEEKEKKDSAQKKEDEERQRKEKKERQQLERRYAIPDNPAIIVHPNTTAKSGKFDCSVMTLSLLLDYRPEDNKEHSFEVSLFAELFNEMLMRDFGFTIYKALVACPPKVEEEKKKKDKKDSKDKDKKDGKDKDKDDKEKDKESKDKDKDDKEKDKKADAKSEEPPAKKKKMDEKEDEKDKDKDVEMEDEEEKEKKEKEDKEKEEKEENESTKDGEEEEEKEEKEEKKEKETKKSSDKEKKEKKKFETFDPELLLACVYYDQNHCSYLMDRDLEDIIQSLGLDLSRAQIRKLVQKVVSKESFHYRKVCDQVQVKEGETPPPRNMLPFDLEATAKGNAEFLVAARAAMGPGGAAPANSPSTRSGRGKDKDKESGDFVMYRGSVVDLESLMQKLEGSDRSRSELENKLAEMTSQLSNIKSNLSSKEETVKTVKQELVHTQSKLKTEVTHRVAMETTKIEWETVATEAKASLQHALTLLRSIGEEEERPLENGADDSQEKQQTKEAGAEAKVEADVEVKMEPESPAKKEK